MLGGGPKGGDVEAIVGAASRDDLIRAWRGAYGRLPPSGLSRQLLEHAAAWAMQAKPLGKRPKRIQRRLATAAEDPKAGVAAGRRRDCPPGMRLARNWGGRTHLVEVVDGGFVYDGRTYRSLSAIAREITGARWSGPRFFGLGEGDA